MFYLHLWLLWLRAQVANAVLWIRACSLRSAVNRNPGPSQEPVAGALDRKPFGRLTENTLWEYAHPSAPDSHVVMDPWLIDRLLRENGDGENWAEAVDILRSAAETDQIAPGTTLAVIAQQRRMKAFGDLAQLSRKVFSLPTVEEKGADGWSDGMAFLLLTDYLGELSKLQSEFLPLPKLLARPAV